MPDLRVEVEHGLGTEAARTRVKGLLAELQRKHAALVSEVTEDWRDHVCTFTFTVKGAKITGTLTVEDGRIVVEGKYPWVLRPFRGKVTQIIRDRAAQLLA